MNLGIFDPNKKYPLRVVIREQRGGNTKWNLTDRGGRFKNDLGVDVIRLKKKKEEFAAPPFGFYDTSTDGHSVLEVFSPKGGIYIPIKHVPSDVVEKLYLSDSSVDEWAALKRKELARLTKPSQPWWEKWIPLFGILGVVAMLMISIIFTYNAIPGMLGQEGSNIEKIYQTSLIQAGLHPTQTVTVPPKIGG